MAQQIDEGTLRKRILLFYVAAGLNLGMGFFVLTTGGGTATRGTLWMIALVFLGFAALNYYVARSLRSKWEAVVRQRPKDAL